VTRRIHQLAKEIGITSTAIVAKCQAEGLDIKNHMSTMSAGLEATIREWFSGDALSTTVETSAPVDLEKVKAKKPRIRKGKTETEKTTEEPEAQPISAEPVLTEEKPVEVEVKEQPVAELSVADKQSPADRSAKPKRISPKERHIEKQPEGEPSANETLVTTSIASADVELTETTETEKQTEVKVAEEGVKTSPEPPQQSPVFVRRMVPKPRQIDLKPVPYTPTPAKLSGPAVIRTERPDFAPLPPKSPRRGKPVVTPEIAVPLPPAGDGKSGSRRKRRRVGVDEEQTEAGKKLVKQHRQRGGRKYDDTVPDKHAFGIRDLKEREERLAMASGTLLHRRERRMASAGHETSGTSGVIERKHIDKVTIKEPITVKELSAAIGVRTPEIMQGLVNMGVMATVNHVLDATAAVMIALEHGVELIVEKKLSLLAVLDEKMKGLTAGATLQARPPVVAFLGHVDHGKTSLLDRIRQANVTKGEAGGITQHIGSYLYDDGKHRVAFLDTPGHKAFTEMRARGANMTDIVVLVVAADDGVMPQTEEAINHAKAAGVPIVVALNKMDLPNADVNKVLGQLAEKGLVSSEWGGNTEIVRTSATTGDGIDDLVEHLEYVAELQQLKARMEGPATGWVIESQMTTGQGAVARLLIKDGELKPGDIVVSGCSYGRVRTMRDVTGKATKKAGPATPVVITGLNEIPVAGDRFYVVESVPEAAEAAAEQQNQNRQVTLARSNQVTLDNLFSEIAAGDLKELNVIIKADVQGSVDVLRNSITELNTAEVAIRVLHAAVGGVTESDVLLAHASNAIIIGFQVIADERSRALAEKENVEIRLYSIIYKISDDIKLALEGMLAPRIEEKFLGRAEVRQIFRISRIGVVAGCYVTEGLITRSSQIKVVRDGIVVRDKNSIDSLRRVKDDASEVRSGLECGIKLVGFNDLKTGDIVEAYELVEHSRTLESTAKGTNKG